MSVVGLNPSIKVFFACQVINVHVMKFHDATKRAVLAKECVFNDVCVLEVAV